MRRWFFVGLLGIGLLAGCGSNAGMINYDYENNPGGGQAPATATAEVVETVIEDQLGVYRGATAVPGQPTPTLPPEVAALVDEKTLAGRMGQGTVGVLHDGLLTVIEPNGWQHEVQINREVVTNYWLDPAGLGVIEVTIIGDESGAFFRAGRPGNSKHILETMYNHRLDDLTIAFSDLSEEHGYVLTAFYGRDKRSGVMMRGLARIQDFGSYMGFASVLVHDTEYEAAAEVALYILMSLTIDESVPLPE